MHEVAGWWVLGSSVDVEDSCVGLSSGLWLHVGWGLS